MCEAYGWHNPVELLQDIHKDYRKALNNHRSKNNTKAIEIFESLNALLDARIPEIIDILEKTD